MGYFAEAHGVKPIIIGEMSREISLSDLIAIWKVFRLFRRVRPDLVHTHTAKAGTVGRVAGLIYKLLTPSLLFGKSRSCRFIHTYHGHVFHSYYGPLKTRVFILLEKILARVATDRITVLSEQQRREIHEDFGVGRREQLRVIPLGLDLSVFADWPKRRNVLRDEIGASDDEILVGIVGRLTEIKNHELFLNAAAQYKDLHRGKTGKRVRWLIVGDGHLRGKLTSLARNLGLEKDLIFLGSRVDPENFYPAFDIVGLTSLNEGTPLTIIEAMANERPIVASAVGGVIDLLGPKRDDSSDEYTPFTLCDRGFRVRPYDAEAFCDAMAQLIENPALRSELGERGRRFVQENYSLERLIKDTSALYRQLSQGKVLQEPARTTDESVSVKTNV
jgi:glycosyltransferase involved in cell wall biosynthesis